MALELANPKKLAKIKSQLTKNKAKKPLFDTEKFVRDLEKSYISCVKKRIKKNVIFFLNFDEKYEHKLAILVFLKCIKYSHLLN